MNMLKFKSGIKSRFWSGLMAGAMAAAMLVLSPCASARAEEVTASLRPSALPRPGDMPAGSTMKRIQERGRLIVGVSLDKYNISYLNPLTNELEGFDVDIARQVARAIFGDEKHIQFVAVSSASRIPMIKDGTVDMVVSTFTINEARKKEIRFSEVYYNAGQKILVQRSSPVASVADLSGQRVCAPKGSTSAKNVVAANPQVKLVETVEFTDCLVLFQQHQADAISTDDVILAGLAAQDPFAKVVGAKFTSEPYGIGVNMNQPDLVRFINAVLSDIKGNGTWTRIYNRWFGIMGPQEAPRGVYSD